MNVLRKLVFIVILSVLVKNVVSQEQYYMYIQSQSHQSFYARIGSETFISSGNGYLLLPGLTKNTYELVIGFPGAKISEWRFNCIVNDTDLGFILKDKGTGRWQLLNLDQKDGLTGTVVEQPKEVKAEEVPLAGVISDDPFSAMLAGVVNDPSIRQQLVIIDKKAVPVSTNISESSLAVAPSVPINANANNQPAGSATPAVVSEEAKPVVIEPEIKKSETVAVGEIEKPNSARAENSGQKGVVQKKEKTVTVKTQKPAVVAEEAKPVIIEPEIKKNETFVVREIEKPNPTQSEKPVQKEVAQKGDKAIVANTQKQYEPFVVKETVEPVNVVDTKATNAAVPAAAEKKDSGGLAAAKDAEPFVVKEITTKHDNAQTSQTPNTTTKKDIENSEEVKYLPFVIKPADKTDNNEAVQSSDKVTDKKVETQAAIAVEKKTTSPVVKNEGQPERKEKKKAVKSEMPADGSNIATQKGNPTPDTKKAVLSAVKKTLERKSKDGVDLIYIDENVYGAKDTIRIFIPAVK